MIQIKCLQKGRRAAKFLLLPQCVVCWSCSLVSRWATDRQQVAHATPACIIPFVGVLNVPLALPALGLPHFHGLVVAAARTARDIKARGMTIKLLQFV